MRKEEFQDFQATLDKLVDLAVGNNNPSIYSNIDEAAFSYENDLWESGFKECGYSPQEVSDAFKAGAEWMAGQGISVEGDTENGLPEEYYIRLEDYLNSLPKGTKLVFQTRKKQ